MSATTRTSLSSSAQGEASAPRADGSAAPRNAHSLAQTLRASRGVMSTHQRPRSGTSMQRRRRAVRTVREKLAQVRSSALRPTNTALPRSSRKTIDLCAMKIGPATQVGHLVFAQHGERAAEGLGSLHVRLFTGDMMSKWHDVWRLPSDSMSNAHAAD